MTEMLRALSLFCKKEELLTHMLLISFFARKNPEILKFSEAINKSFWVHSEVDFTADTQDFHAHLSEAEQNAVKNSLLAIAQVGQRQPVCLSKHPIV